MKCIIPVDFTDAILISSSIPETEASVYSATTTYGVGDKCLVNHIVYTSLAASNIGNYPPTDIAATTPKWSQGSYTNRWAMFDKYMNTASETTGDDIVVVLDSSYCDSISLFNVIGNTITVDVKNSSGTAIYTETVSLLATEVKNWEQFFFSPRDFASTAWVEFPIKTSSTLTITVKGAAPAIGKVVMGNAKTIGRTQYDAKISKTDYSIYSTDTFGQIYLSRGNYARNFAGDVYVKPEDLIEVDNTTEKIRATITAFFCGNAEDAYGLYKSMILCGYLKGFDVVIPRLRMLECSVEISGTT